MRHLILSILFFAGMHLHAQPDNKYYLFPEFQEGLVYYKDGRQFTASLNYHLIGKRFQFLDPSDNNIVKDFAEPEKVTLVKIGDRAFLHDPKEMREVVHEDPSILVQYRAQTRAKGKNAGYGGTSETSAIEGYSGIISEGKYSQFERGEAIILSSVDKIYYLQIKNKYQRFTNEKTFLKIYPAHKELLSAYIKENKIDFNNIDQVIQLCLQAKEL